MQVVGDDKKGLVAFVDEESSQSYTFAYYVRDSRTTAKLLAYLGSYAGEISLEHPAVTQLAGKDEKSNFIKFTLIRIAKCISPHDCYYHILLTTLIIELHRTLATSKEI